MSITSKMTSLTVPDKITIGKDVYDILQTIVLILSLIAFGVMPTIDAIFV
jgi:hypothetical protein